ncbi:hypothetical protein MMPV_008244 [Pyropia vietnamensis]
MPPPAPAAAGVGGHPLPRILVITVEAAGLLSLPLNRAAAASTLVSTPHLDAIIAGGTTTRLHLPPPPASPLAVITHATPPPPPPPPPPGVHPLPLAAPPALTLPPWTGGDVSAAADAAASTAIAAASDAAGTPVVFVGAPDLGSADAIAGALVATAWTGAVALLLIDPMATVGDDLRGGASRWLQGGDALPGPPSPVAAGGGGAARTRLTVPRQSWEADAGALAIDSGDGGPPGVAGGGDGGIAAATLRGAADVPARVDDHTSVAGLAAAAGGGGGGGGIRAHHWLNELWSLVGKREKYGA